jgi:hypothetical protein
LARKNWRRYYTGISFYAASCGVLSFRVNPYHPKAEDLERLKEIDLLILAHGYAELVRRHYSGDMIEVGVRSMSPLKASGRGSVR